MVDLIEVWLKPVVTQFIPDNQEKQEAGRNTNGQPDNINGRISFMPGNISYRRF